MGLSAHARPLVVQRAREDAGGGRLADAAHAGQHVGLRDPVHLERVAQRADHDLLADEVVESLGAVFARKDDVRRSRLRILRWVRGLSLDLLMGQKGKLFLRNKLRASWNLRYRHREAALAAVAIQKRTPRLWPWIASLRSQ